MTSHAVHSLLAGKMDPTSPELFCHVHVQQRWCCHVSSSFLHLLITCCVQERHAILLLVTYHVNYQRSSRLDMIDWLRAAQPSLNRSCFLASQISCQVGLDYQFCSVGLFFSIFENIIAWCLPLCLQWSFLVTISCKNWVNCKQTIVL